MKKLLAAMLEQSYRECVRQGLLVETALPFIDVELPKDANHGDYASNIAMVLASRLKMNPRRIAEILISQISDRDKALEKIEIAGPGFINFFVRGEMWRQLLKEVDDQGEAYGKNDLGKGTRVQVEFVSANPTGPLHIGHARGAVVGDVIARLLEASQFSVSREYYINDAGNQMHNLGRSVFLRYRQLKGEEVEFPEDCYQGEYVTEIAREMMEKFGDKPFHDEAHVIPFCTRYAADVVLEGIKNDLREFDVCFNQYFSETKLYEENGLYNILNELEKKGFIYDDGQTRWFKATAFGDEKDRVVIRKNGEPTYFAADIAYHLNKFSRGFDRVIDVWGADHHGYIPRMKAAVQALGREKEALEVVLVQLVNLLREGKPVAMSTRAGEFVTMKEVVDEVGKDAARFNFLMRRSDSHLDFDLELAKKQSIENPVYYVQYAHARICSIFGMAKERRVEIPAYGGVDVSRLDLPEETVLIKTILRFPETIEGAAQALEPHRLTFYLLELAGIFHNYYNKHRVLSGDWDTTLARLLLVKSIRTVLRSGLSLLGVSAPEKM